MSKEAQTEFLLDQAKKALDEIWNPLTTSTYSDNVMCAFWNDWRGRDSRAHVERTFNNGRFSYDRRTFGIVNGKWYCCLKTDAARSKGLALDGERQGGQPQSQPQSQPHYQPHYQPQLQPQQARWYMCPSGHPLFACQVTVLGVGCDRCRRAFMPGVVTHRCNMCNYDVCPLCIQ